MSDVFPSDIMTNLNRTVEESGRKMQGFGFSPLVLPALAGLPTAILPGNAPQYRYIERAADSTSGKI